MARTVPPVKLDNFIDILCNGLYKESGLSTKRILADKNAGVIDTKLGESGARDIINLGLTTGLLKGKVGNALLADDGIRLCEILVERGKGTELWLYLHRCLQRIDVYREYINYLSEPQKEKEAKEFNGKKTTAKTIFRWLQRMGMLSRSDKDESVQYIPIDGERDITEEELLKTVEEIYEEEAREAGPMWRGTFIEIRQLRNTACLRLKIDHDRFDKLLRQLISSDQQHKVKVGLAKGPAAAYRRTGDSAFEFNEEEFLYIALDEVQND